VKITIAEGNFTGLGPLEIEVHVMVPSETETTVNLNTLSRHMPVDVTAPGLGHGGRQRQARVIFRDRPAGTVGNGGRSLHLDSHVGTLVLDGQVNWSYFREYWRLYESGQWLHYLVLRGAWITRETLFEGRSPLPPQHPGYLHVREDIFFTLTEILHFAVWLAHGGVFDSTAFLSIQLHNTHDYMLFESFERFFPHEYVNQSNRPIEQEKSVPVGELPAIADQIALEMAVKVFSVFGWIPSDAAVRTLAEDQKKLIERRL